MNKIKKLIALMFQPRILKHLLSMRSRGYLYEIGWINSFINKMPVDKNSNPMPWFTYPFIDFISDRLNNTMDVFEYGSGNSTLWFASRTNTVTSVEHDNIWFEKIKKKMPKNVNIHYEELIYDGEYSKFPNKLKMKFDIVIVDGRDRVNCIKMQLTVLKRKVYLS